MRKSLWQCLVCQLYRNNVYLENIIYHVISSHSKHVNLLDNYAVDDDDDDDDDDDKKPCKSKGT